MVTCRLLPFGVFQAIVAAKIRGCQGTEAHFSNATTSAAQRAPAETRFDDLGSRQGSAQGAAIRVAAARAWPESVLSTHAVASDEHSYRAQSAGMPARPERAPVGRHAWWPAPGHSPGAPGASGNGSPSLRSRYTRRRVRSGSLGTFRPGGWSRSPNAGGRPGYSARGRC